MSTSPTSSSVPTPTSGIAAPIPVVDRVALDPRSWPTSWRVASAVALVASPVLSVAAVFLAPRFDDRAARLSAVAADPAPFEMASAVQVAALPFAAAAVVVLSLLAFAGSPRLALLGGILGVVGGIGHSVVAGVELMTDAVAAGGLDVGALAVVDANLASPPVIVAAVLFLPVSVIGYVLRGVALWRSRAVPGVVLALFALWLPVDFVGGYAGGPYAGPALGVVVGIAFATVVLRTGRGGASSSVGREG